jgi:hypothetical protein
MHPKCKTQIFVGVKMFGIKIVDKMGLFYAKYAYSVTLSF